MDELKAVIADDDPHIRIIMRNVVSRLGGRVVAMVSNGEEALDAVAEHDPDLLLLDVRMPVMGGLEVLKTMQTRGQRPSVIMLTAVADRTTVQQCAQLGASAYVRKDTPLVDLVEAVESAIDREMRAGQR